MATRFVGTPYSAEFPATNFPQLLASNRRPVLAFDAATSETAYWTFVAPQGLTGAITAVISYAMASATSGVAFDVAVEALTSGDAVDTDAATSFDSVNTGTDAAVPGTAGYMEQISITLTNADGMTAADLVRVSVARAIANAADTATGDCYVFAIEIRDAA
jgi:hypothetical protein